MSDGTVIPNVVDQTEWDTLRTRLFFVGLSEDISNKDIYGGLYNWYTVDTKKLCPEGWHVPSTTEWNDIIVTYLTNSAGGKMKEVGLTYCELLLNAGATNSSGFSARGAGCRSNDNVSLKRSGLWWSTTLTPGIRRTYLSIFSLHTTT